jgi:hypothetical protein
MNGFMITKVALLPRENDSTLPFFLFITNSVLNEIGMHAAAIITK